MSRWALQPVCCSGVTEARSLMRGSNPTLIFCDEKLDDGSYRDLLRDFTAPRKPCFVVMASSPDVDQTFKEAVSLGAFDLIAEPCKRSDVQWIAVRALQEDAKRSGSRRRSILFGARDATPEVGGETNQKPSGEPQ
jgi:DNA-binding NtrC family response regulator